MSTRKKYPTDFKAKVVLEILKEEKSVSQLSSEYGIHPSILNRWRNMVIEKLPSFFTDEQKNLENIKAQYEKQIQDLYAEVGRLSTELTWLKKKEWSLSLTVTNASPRWSGTILSCPLRNRRNY